MQFIQSKSFILTALLLAVVFVFLGLSLIQVNTTDAATSSPYGTRQCTISTSSVKVVGHQTSRTVLAAYSNRAWARIQQRFNATNTAYLSMDDGAAATAAESLFLARAASTSPTFIEFGLNTELPYTGAVTVLNSTGTSTILVTECRY